MNRTIIAALFAVASIGAHASCLSIAAEADNIATMRDNGTTAKDMKAIYAAETPKSDTDDLQWQSTIIDAIYKSKVKPWNANALANGLCNPQQTAAPSRSASIVSNPKCPYGARTIGDGSYQCVRSPQEVAADEAKAEKQREINYRESFNKMPNIPGICVGDECNHIRKIQHWDANGNMTN
ncbi:hypothetical protein PQR70_33705 [Paraburkholderia madseniana]|uniref:hypothetical protein n=1 Tax=Paraburkholderia madseniana TaxID=2599607 RepID=UPI0038BB491A